LIDTSHRDWFKDYEDLLSWIKPLVNDKEALRVNSGKSVWEVSIRQNELASVAIRRRRRNSVEEMEPRKPPRSQPPAFAAPSFPNSSKASQARRLAPRLHIKEWFLGTEHRDYKTRSYISWERDIITFKEQADIRRAPMQFDVRSDIGSMKFSESSSTEFPVLTLQTLPTRNGSKKDSDYFKMGDRHAQGSITALVDTSHCDWFKDYKDFLSWIKPLVNDKEVLRGNSGKTIWEVSIRPNAFGQIF